MKKKFRKALGIILISGGGFAALVAAGTDDYKLEAQSQGISTEDCASDETIAKTALAGGAAMLVGLALYKYDGKER